MKKICMFAAFAALACIALLSMSCSENDAAPPVIPEDNIVTIERYMSETRSNLTLPGRNTTIPILTVSYNAQTLKVVDYEFSEEMLSSVGATAQQMDDHLRQEMGPLYFSMDAYPYHRPEVLMGKEGPFWTFLKCKKWCEENYEKGDGLGGCKAACWGDLAIELAERIKNIIM